MGGGASQLFIESNTTESVSSNNVDDTRRRFPVLFPSTTMFFEEVSVETQPPCERNVPTAQSPRYPFLSRLISQKSFLNPRRSFQHYRTYSADVSQQCGSLQNLNEMNSECGIGRGLVGDQRKLSFSITDTSLDPVFIACQYGFTDRFVQLIANNTCDINSPDDRGCTLLYIACYKGHLDIAQILLARYVDVNVGKPPFSPLYAAAKNGHLDVVRLLLQHSANLYLCDNEQFMAYDVAATKEIQDALLDAHDKQGDGLCKICWEKPIHGAFAFSPCKHNILCRQCDAQMIVNGITCCPICRAQILCRSNSMEFKIGGSSDELY